MHGTRVPGLWAPVLLVVVVVLTQPVISALASAPTHPEGSAVVEAPTAASPASPVREYNLTQQTAYPLAIATDSHGNVWFAEDNVDALVEFIPSNSTFRTYRIPTQSHLAWIWFLVPDSSGNIWFADESQSLLWRFDPATGGFANFTAGGALPMVLSYDAPRNRMWFTSLETNQVGYFVLDGGEARLGRVINVTAPLPGAGVAGIVVGPSGDVYVAESFQAKILELNGNDLSVVKTWALPPGSEPVGLALDEQRGRLWFTNHASSFFGYVGLNSPGYTEFPTSLLFEGGSYTVTLPYWIQLSSSGDVWFNEHFADKIARFDPGTQQLTEFNIPTNNSSPLRFVVDDRAGEVWFTEFEGNAIGMVPENSSLSQSVTVQPPSVSVRPSGTVTAGGSPEASPSSVSANNSITGEPAPGIAVSKAGNGGSFRIRYTADGAQPGRYMSAVCFSYPGIRQCGYVLLAVARPRSTGLIFYGVYGGIAVAAAVILFGLFRERRRDEGGLRHIFLRALLARLATSRPPNAAAAVSPRARGTITSASRYAGPRTVNLSTTE